MSYWQHKFKCMKCGLHFVVCSDHEEWPDHNTTRELQLNEATGLVYCPECGNYRGKLHWKQEVEGFINETVPGAASLAGMH